jgi:ABC-type transport system involved in cytochrome bd biosynthesis fused ATPase/permease subunit
VLPIIIKDTITTTAIAFPVGALISEPSFQSAFTQLIIALVVAVTRHIVTKRRARRSYARRTASKLLAHV